jgi:Icc-related predicted phosphoesterase
MKIIAVGDFHGKFPEKLKAVIRKEKPDLILSDGDYAGIDDFRPALKKMFKENDKGNKINLPDILGEEKYVQLLKKDYSAGKMPLIELNKFRIPVMSVFGNGDWYKWETHKSARDYSNLIKKLIFIKNINRKSAKIFNIKISGFGGYIDNDAYFDRQYIKKHGDSVESVKARKKRYEKDKKNFSKEIKIKPDILLLHYTPFNCLDVMKEKGYYLTGKHMGISFFNEGILKHKPALVVCGHMHENPGQCKIGDSVIVNPGAAGDGKCAVIEFDEKKKRVLDVKFI